VRDIAVDTVDWIDDFIGRERKTPLEGRRIPVLPADQVAGADPSAQRAEFALPEAVNNPAWPQAGGSTEHVMGHLAASGINAAWRSDAGRGTYRSGEISTAPVIGDGRIFVIDAASVVRSFDAGSGARGWRFDTEPEDTRSEGVGGGLAYDQGKVYAATGYAQVVALEAGSGRQIWRTQLTAPARAAPTVGDGRVFAVTIDGQLHALDIQNGSRLWTHTSSGESAGFYGMASPALSGGVLVAGFTSGEVVALRADTGRVLWNDALSGVVRTDTIAGLPDIRGLPVIDRGLVFVASNGGRTASIDLRTGGRNWEREIGSRHTPWVAGENIFVTGTDNRLSCLVRRDGRVRWVRQLPQFRLPDRRRDRLEWTGPILAGGRVVVASSLGQLLAVNPANGETVGEARLPDAALITPIVANGTIYVLTADATLVALR
jgi:outer membrane protein assembly factor BamB